MEIVRPEFLPVTLISISRNRERRSFRASFRAGMRTSCRSLTKDDGSARRRVPHPCGFQGAVLFRAKPDARDYGEVGSQDMLDIREQSDNLIIRL
jgi:hypothetical protein